MKKICLFFVAWVVSTSVLSQTAKPHSFYGICIFNDYPGCFVHGGRAKDFQFLKTEQKNISAGALVKLLNSNVTYDLRTWADSIINYSLFLRRQTDSFSYGYTDKDDHRINTLYYCNCKLVFSDTTVKKNDLHLKYTSRQLRQAHKERDYLYTYKGEFTHFFSMYYQPQPDSVILFGK